MNKQEQQLLKDKIQEAEAALEDQLELQPAWDQLELRLRPKRKSFAW